MVIRNFYLYCESDGYKKPITCSTKDDNRAMAIDLMVNHEGVSKSILKIGCFHRSDGTNVVNIDIDGYPKTITLKYHK